MEFFQPITEIILSIFPTIKAILLAIIPLGFLIFIHELGHFLAAKRSGIKVIAFSLGFGPKIVGFTHGETLYKLSLLPFGGYVQMEGENPSEQTGAEGEFASASLGKRAYVVIAGPAVNLLFGILTYWFVFGVGLDADSAGLISRLTGQSFHEKQQSVQIGMLDDDGPAGVGGVMPGDTIVSIDDTPITNWNIFQTKILTNPEEELEFVVKRDDKLETLTVIPEAIVNLRGSSGQIRVTETNDVFVSDVIEGSLATQAGIIVGDQIETINGQKLYTVPVFNPGIWHPQIDWRGQPYQAYYNQINQKQGSLELGIRRSVEKDTVEKLTFDLPVTWQITTFVQKKSTAAKAGIKDRDVLVSINGTSVDSTTLYTELEKVGDSPISLGFLRDGTEKSFTISPAERSKKDEENTFYGIRWTTYLSGMSLDRPPLPEFNFFSAFWKGCETTWLTLTSITRTLKQLIGGEVSPRYLSGPIGIADVTSRMFASVSVSTILFFIGFISINLAIVNLLPLPIADGGHLLFFAVEKLRGRPLPLKAQAIIQQVSFVLIIALALYITWFDSLTLFDKLRN
ncbi:MAG: site-2 protease family protein [Candidatus Poribacteria bacterium]|nr:site-2 protease family protein [Candidatus Poribacteria bacterium]